MLKTISEKKLIAGKESAYLSHMLGTICVEAPIDTDINSYIPAKEIQRERLGLWQALSF